MTHLKNSNSLLPSNASTPILSFLYVLLSGLLVLWSPSISASTSPSTSPSVSNEQTPAQTESPIIAKNVEPSPKNGFALLGVLQGTGSYIGTGIAVQTPKFWDFMAIQLNLVSNSTGRDYERTWWESVLAFRLVPQAISSNHIRPYVSLEIAKEFWPGVAMGGDSLHLRSPSVGVEFKNLVKSLWGDDSIRTNMFFFEISPQTSSLRDSNGAVLFGSSLLIKAGFGVVL